MHTEDTLDPSDLKSTPSLSVTGKRIKGRETHAIEIPSERGAEKTLSVLAHGGAIQQ